MEQLIQQLPDIYPATEAPANLQQYFSRLVGSKGSFERQHTYRERVEKSNLAFRLLWSMASEPEPGTQLHTMIPASHPQVDPTYISYMHQEESRLRWMNYEVGLIASQHDHPLSVIAAGISTITSMNHVVPEQLQQDRSLAIAALRDLVPLLYGKGTVDLAAVDYLERAFAPSDLDVRAEYADLTGADLDDDIATGNIAYRLAVPRGQAQRAPDWAQQTMAHVRADDPRNKTMIIDIAPEYQASTPVLEALGIDPESKVIPVAAEGVSGNKLARYCAVKGRSVIQGQHQASDNTYYSGISVIRNPNDSRRGYDTLVRSGSNEPATLQEITLSKSFTIGDYEVGYHSTTSADHPWQDAVEVMGFMMQQRDGTEVPVAVFIKSDGVSMGFRKFPGASDFVHAILPESGRVAELAVERARAYIQKNGFKNLARYLSAMHVQEESAAEQIPGRSFYNNEWDLAAGLATLEIQVLNLQTGRAISLCRGSKKDNGVTVGIDSLGGQHLHNFGTDGVCYINYPTNDVAAGSYLFSVGVVSMTDGYYKGDPREVLALLGRTCNYKALLARNPKRDDRSLCYAIKIQ